MHVCVTILAFVDNYEFNETIDKINAFLNCSSLSNAHVGWFLLLFLHVFNFTISQTRPKTSWLFKDRNCTKKFPMFSGAQWRVDLKAVTEFYLLYIGFMVFFIRKDGVQ